MSLLMTPLIALFIISSVVWESYRAYNRTSFHYWWAGASIGILSIAAVFSFNSIIYPEPLRSLFSLEKSQPLLLSYTLSCLNNIYSWSAIILTVQAWARLTIQCSRWVTILSASILSLLFMQYIPNTALETPQLLLSNACIIILFGNILLHMARTNITILPAAFAIWSCAPAGRALLCTANQYYFVSVFLANALTIALSYLFSHYLSSQQRRFVDA